MDEAELEVRIRTAFHELRWCKWSDTLHAIAHDDEDEDGYRAALIAALQRKDSNDA